MDNAQQIILCQPDSRKGCSVCCGLFNFTDCRRASLEKFLEKGPSRCAEFSSYDMFHLEDEVRDGFTHICPYQGFLSRGKPGCLIHPLSTGIEGRDRSLFAHKVCSAFLCPAHGILTREEKETLVLHVNDWYLYSAAIIDPETFSFLLEFITAKYQLAASHELTGLLLNAGLEAHADILASGSKSLFNYSCPEYILNREKFCVRYNGEARETVLACVRSAAHEKGL